MTTTSPQTYPNGSQYSDVTLLSFLDEMTMRFSLVHDDHFTAMLNSMLPRIIPFSLYSSPQIKLKVMKLHSMLQKRIKVLKDFVTLPLADLIMLYQHYTAPPSNLYTKADEEDLSPLHRSSIQQICLFYIDLGVDTIIHQTKDHKGLKSQLLSGLGACLLHNINQFATSLQPQHINYTSVVNSDDSKVSLLSNLDQNYIPNAFSASIFASLLKIILKLLSCPGSHFFQSSFSENVASILDMSTVPPHIIEATRQFRATYGGFTKPTFGHFSTTSTSFTTASTASTASTNQKVPSRITDEERVAINSILMTVLPQIASSPHNSVDMSDIDPKLGFVINLIIDTVVSPRLVVVPTSSSSKSATKSNDSNSGYMGDGDGDDSNNNNNNNNNNNTNMIKNEIEWSLPSPLIVEFHKRLLFTQTLPLSSSSSSPSSLKSGNDNLNQVDANNEQIAGLNSLYYNNLDLEIFSNLLIDLFLFSHASSWLGLSSNNGSSNKNQQFGLNGQFMPGLGPNKYQILKTLLSQSIPPHAQTPTSTTVNPTSPTSNPTTLGGQNVTSNITQTQEFDITQTKPFLSHYLTICNNIIELCSTMLGSIVYSFENRYTTPSDQSSDSSSAATPSSTNGALGTNSPRPQSQGSTPLTSRTSNGPGNTQSLTTIERIGQLLSTFSQNPTNNTTQLRQVMSLLPLIFNTSTQTQSTTPSTSNTLLSNLKILSQLNSNPLSALITTTNNTTHYPILSQFSFYSLSTTTLSLMTTLSPPPRLSQSPETIKQWCATTYQINDLITPVDENNDDNHNDKKKSEHHIQSLAQHGVDPPSCIDLKSFLSSTLKSLTDVFFLSSFIIITNEQYVSKYQQWTNKQTSMGDHNDNITTTTTTPQPLSDFIKLSPNYTLCPTPTPLSHLTYQHTTYSPFSTSSTPTLPIDLFIPLLFTTLVSPTLTSNSIITGAGSSWLNTAMDMVKMLISTNSFYEINTTSPLTKTPHPIFIRLSIGINRLYKLLIGDDTLNRQFITQQSLGMGSTQPITLAVGQKPPTEQQILLSNLTSPTTSWLWSPITPLNFTTTTPSPFLTSLRRVGCTPIVKQTILPILGQLHSTAMKISPTPSFSYRLLQAGSKLTIPFSNSIIFSPSISNPTLFHPWVLLPAQSMLVFVLKDALSPELPISTSTMASNNSTLIPHLKYITAVLEYVVTLLHGFERVAVKSNNVNDVGGDHNNRLTMSSENTQQDQINIITLPTQYLLKLATLFTKFDSISSPLSLLTPQTTALILSLLSTFLAKCDQYALLLSTQSLTDYEKEQQTAAENEPEELMKLYQRAQMAMQLNPSSTSLEQSTASMTKQQQKTQYTDTQPLMLLWSIRGEVCYLISLLISHSATTAMNGVVPSVGAEEVVTDEETSSQLINQSSPPLTSPTSLSIADFKYVFLLLMSQLDQDTFFPSLQTSNNHQSTQYHSSFSAIATSNNVNQLAQRSINIGKLLKLHEFFNQKRNLAELLDFLSQNDVVGTSNNDDSNDDTDKNSSNTNKRSFLSKSLNLKQAMVTTTQRIVSGLQQMTRIFMSSSLFSEHHEGEVTNSTSSSTTSQPLGNVTFMSILLYYLIFGSPQQQEVSLRYITTCFPYQSIYSRYICLFIYHYAIQKIPSSSNSGNSSTGSGPNSGSTNNQGINANGTLSVDSNHYNRLKQAALRGINIELYLNSNQSTLPYQHLNMYTNQSNYPINTLVQLITMVGYVPQPQNYVIPPMSVYSQHFSALINRALTNLAFQSPTAPQFTHTLTLLAQIFTFTVATINSSLSSQLSMKRNYLQEIMKEKGLSSTDHSSLQFLKKLLPLRLNASLGGIHPTKAMIFALFPLVIQSTSHHYLEDKWGGDNNNDDDQEQQYPICSIPLSLLSYDFISSLIQSLQESLVHSARIWYETQWKGSSSPSASSSSDDKKSKNFPQGTSPLMNDGDVGSEQDGENQFNSISTRAKVLDVQRLSYDHMNDTIKDDEQILTMMTDHDQSNNVPTSSSFQSYDQNAQNRFDSFTTEKNSHILPISHYLTHLVQTVTKNTTLLTYILFLFQSLQIAINHPFELNALPSFHQQSSNLTPTMVLETILSPPTRGGSTTTSIRSPALLLTTLRAILSLSQSSPQLVHFLHHNTNLTTSLVTVAICNNTNNVLSVSISSVLASIYALLVPFVPSSILTVYQAVLIGLDKGSILDLVTNDTKKSISTVTPKFASLQSISSLISFTDETLITAETTGLLDVTKSSHYSSQQIDSNFKTTPMTSLPTLQQHTNYSTPINIVRLLTPTSRQLPTVQDQTNEPNHKSPADHYVSTPALHQRSIPSLLFFLSITTTQLLSRHLEITPLSQFSLRMVFFWLFRPYSLYSSTLTLQGLNITDCNQSNPLLSVITDPLLKKIDAVSFYSFLQGAIGSGNSSSTGSSGGQGGIVALPYQWLDITTASLDSLQHILSILPLSTFLDIVNANIASNNINDQSLKNDMTVDCKDDGVVINETVMVEDKKDKKNQTCISTNSSDYNRPINFSIILDLCFNLIKFSLQKRHKNLQGDDSSQSNSTNNNANQATDEMGRLASSTETTNVLQKTVQFLSVLPQSLSNHSTYILSRNNTLLQSSNNMVDVDSIQNNENHQQQQQQQHNQQSSQKQVILIDYLYHQLKLHFSSIFFVDTQLIIANLIAHITANQLIPCPYDWNCDTYTSHLIPVISCNIPLLNNNKVSTANNGQTMALFNVERFGPLDYQLQFEQVQRQQYRERQSQQGQNANTPASSSPSSSTTTPSSPSSNTTNNLNTTQSSSTSSSSSTSNDQSNGIHYNLTQWSPNDTFSLPPPQLPFYQSSLYIPQYQPPFIETPYDTTSKASKIESSSLAITPLHRDYFLVLLQSIVFTFKQNYQQYSLAKKHSIAMWLLGIVAHSYTQDIFINTNNEEYKTIATVQSSKDENADICISFPSTSRQHSELLGQLQSVLLLLITDNANVLIREAACTTLTFLFQITKSKTTLSNALIRALSSTSTQNQRPTGNNVMDLGANDIFGQNFNFSARVATSTSTLSSLIDLCNISKELKQPSLIYTLLSTTLTSTIWQTPYFSLYKHSYIISNSVFVRCTPTSTPTSTSTTSTVSTSSSTSLQSPQTSGNSCNCAVLPPQLLNLVPKLLIHKQDSVVVVKDTMHSLLLLIAPHLTTVYINNGLFLIKSILRRLKVTIGGTAGNSATGGSINGVGNGSMASGTSSKTRRFALLALIEILSTISTTALLNSGLNNNNNTNATHTPMDNNNNRYNTLFTINANTTSIVSLLMDLYSTLWIVLQEADIVILSTAKHLSQVLLTHVVNILSNKTVLVYSSSNEAINSPTTSSSSSSSSTMTSISNANYDPSQLRRIFMSSLTSELIPKGIQSPINTVYLPTLMLLLSIASTATDLILSFVPQLLPLIIETMSIKDPMMLSTLATTAITDQFTSFLSSQPQQQGIQQPQDTAQTTQQQQLQQLLLSQQDALNRNNTTNQGNPNDAILNNLLPQQAQGMMSGLGGDITNIDTFRLKLNENGMLYHIAKVLLSSIITTHPDDHITYVNNDDGLSNDDNNNNNNNNTGPKLVLRQKSHILSSTIDSMLVSIINNAKYSLTAPTRQNSITSPPQSQPQNSGLLPSGGNGMINPLDALANTLSATNNSHLLSLQGSLHILSSIVELAYKQSLHLTDSIGTFSTLPPLTQSTYIITVVFNKLDSIATYLYRTLKSVTGSSNTSINSGNLVTIQAIVNVISHCFMIALPNYYYYTYLGHDFPVNTATFSTIKPSKSNNNSNNTIKSMTKLIPKMVNTMFTSFGLTPTPFVPTTVAGISMTGNTDVNFTMGTLLNESFDFITNNTVLLNNGIVNLLIFDKITSTLSTSASSSLTVSPTMDTSSNDLPVGLGELLRSNPSISQLIQAVPNVESFLESIASNNNNIGNMNQNSIQDLIQSTLGQNPELANMIGQNGLTQLTGILSQFQQQQRQQQHHQSSKNSFHTNNNNTINPIVAHVYSDVLELLTSHLSPVLMFTAMTPLYTVLLTPQLQLQVDSLSSSIHRTLHPNEDNNQGNNGNNNSNNTSRGALANLQSSSSSSSSSTNNSVNNNNDVPSGPVHNMIEFSPNTHITTPLTILHDITSTLNPNNINTDENATTNGESPNNITHRLINALSKTYKTDNNNDSSNLITQTPHLHQPVLRLHTLGQKFNYNDQKDTFFVHSNTQLTDSGAYSSSSHQPLYYTYILLSLLSQKTLDQIVSTTLGNVILEQINTRLDAFLSTLDQFLNHQLYYLQHLGLIGLVYILTILTQSNSLIDTIRGNSNNDNNGLIFMSFLQKIFDFTSSSRGIGSTTSSSLISLNHYQFITKQFITQVIVLLNVLYTRLGEYDKSAQLINLTLDYTRKITNADRYDKVDNASTVDETTINHSNNNNKNSHLIAWLLWSISQQIVIISPHYSSITPQMSPLLNSTTFDHLSQALLPSIYIQKNALMSGNTGNTTLAPTKQETMLFESYLESLLCYLIMTTTNKNTTSPNASMNMDDLDQSASVALTTTSTPSQAFYSTLFHIPFIALQTYTTTGAISSSLSLLSFLAHFTPYFTTTSSNDYLLPSYLFTGLCGHFITLIGDTKRVKIRSISLVTLFSLLSRLVNELLYVENEIKQRSRQYHLKLTHMDNNHDNIKELLRLLSTLSEHSGDGNATSGTANQGNLLTIIHLARDSSALLKSIVRYQLAKQQQQQQEQQESKQVGGEEEQVIASDDI